MSKKQKHNINKTGFKVPKDYFNELEDSLVDSIRLKALANKPGFKVYDNYFESFEDRTVKKALELSSPTVISIINKSNLIYASSIAAALLLLLILTVFNKNPHWDHLDIETVENYIIEENIDAYVIAELLIDEDLKEEDFIDYDLKTESIKNYLLENTDIEDLIIEKNYNE